MKIERAANCVAKVLNNDDSIRGNKRTPQGGEIRNLGQVFTAETVTKKSTKPYTEEPSEQSEDSKESILCGREEAFRG